jgi:hypothetical protein
LTKRLNIVIFTLKACETPVAGCAVIIRERGMFKKIVVIALIIIGLIYFYKKFMADSVEGFFSKKADNVDLLGLTTDDATKAVLESEE